MEIIGAFVSAITTAAVTTAVSKLTTVESCETEVQRKVDSLKSEFGFINSLLAQFGQQGRSVLQTECLEQLRCLACEIENCVDFFHAGKADGFADEIGRLSTESVELRARIKDYLDMGQSFAAGSPQGAVQTTQPILGNLDIARGSAVGAGAPVVPIPTELQDLLDDQAQKDWLAKNIEFFLYFSFFPPEHPVSSNLLKRRVLAEGLVKGDNAPSKKKERDNVTDDILEKLVKANIISSTQTSIDGKVETCHHTNPMHACISENSKSLNFLLVCDDNTCGTELEKARRISVHPSANVGLDWPRDLPRLRTLGVFPADKTANSYRDVLDFSRYKVLRVLDLKEFAHLTEEHLDEIVHTRCVLMKYLSLNLGSLEGISDKISKLNQLETLDLCGIDTLTLFQEVLFLPNLKHLLGKFHLSKSEFIRSHSTLKNFVANESKLETLNGFVTGSRYGFEDLMGLMKSLSKVKIWFKSDSLGLKLDVLSKAIEKFIEKSVDEPHCTRSLSIDFTDLNKEFVVKEIVRGKLDSLELRGTLNQFPQFVAGLSEIVELYLFSTGLSWEVIRDGLKNVRGLKYLKLDEDSLGHFDVDIPQNKADHLRSIERISIESSQKLHITLPDDALPLLVSLRILCQALDVSPATPGITISFSHMENLEEIVLHLDVNHAIRTQWEDAARAHPYKHVRVT